MGIWPQTSSALSLNNLAGALKQKASGSACVPARRVGRVTAGYKLSFSHPDLLHYLPASMSGMAPS